MRRSVPASALRMHRTVPSPEGATMSPVRGDAVVDELGVGGARRGPERRTARPSTKVRPSAITSVSSPRTTTRVTSRPRSPPPRRGTWPRTRRMRTRLSDGCSSGFMWRFGYRAVRAGPTGPGPYNGAMEGTTRSSSQVRRARRATSPATCDCWHSADGCRARIRRPVRGAEALFARIPLASRTHNARHAAPVLRAAWLHGVCVDL